MISIDNAAVLKDAFRGGKPSLQNIIAITAGLSVRLVVNIDTAGDIRRSSDFIYQLIPISSIN